MFPGGQGAVSGVLCRGKAPALPPPRFGQPGPPGADGTWTCPSQRPSAACSRARSLALRLRSAVRGARLRQEEARAQRARPASLPVWGERAAARASPRALGQALTYRDPPRMSTRAGTPSGSRASKPCSLNRAEALAASLSRPALAPVPAAPRARAGPSCRRARPTGRDTPVPPGQPLASFLLCFARLLRFVCQLGSTGAVSAGPRKSNYREPNASSALSQRRRLPKTHPGSRAQSATGEPAKPGSRGCPSWVFSQLRGVIPLRVARAKGSLRPCFVLPQMPPLSLRSGIIPGPWPMVRVKQGGSRGRRRHVY